MTIQSLKMSIVAAAALVCCACQSQPPASAGLSDADRTAIRQAADAFTKGVLSKDFASVAANYTQDATMMPPNDKVVEGRDAIQKWMAAFPPMPEFQLQQVDVDGRGDLAYVRGNYSLTMTPPGAPATPDRGKYLEIWRKQSDGSWKIRWDIYNSDLPPSPAPPSASAKSGN